MSKIVDFGALETYIKQIEEIFKKNELNHIEQKLILEQTLSRIITIQKKQQAGDLMQNIPLGGLFKRLTKERDKDDQG